MSASKGSGLRFALAIAAALAFIIAGAMLAGCSVALYSHQWGGPTAAECDAYPEGAEPAACAPYVWRGDQ